jgi:hypothetical protein
MQGLRTGLAAPSRVAAARGCYLDGTCGTINNAQKASLLSQYRMKQPRQRSS